MYRVYLHLQARWIENIPVTEALVYKEEGYVVERMESPHGVTSMSDLKIVIDLVIEQIKKDIEAGDVTAIEELLTAVPMDSLVGYLPENTWEIDA